MKITLCLLLAACGDNLSPPMRDAVFPLSEPVAMGHSPESTVVTSGTYKTVTTQSSQGEPVVAWELSSGGQVYIPLHGIPQGSPIARFEVVGLSVAPVGIEFVDQVQNESVTLPISCDGSLVQQGKVSCTLDAPGLVLGSRGEFVWIRATTSGAPATLWSVYWTAE